MLKSTLALLSASALAAVVALGPVIPTTASAVTDADINEQTHVVQINLVGTLTEYVKLLQLTFIQQLEFEVARLETLADGQ
jgi:hypothetical protein